ncbi:hypothetical protein HDK77DRAFT_425485 [Phyllosticta capitalensis]|uniref:Secreted protein n=2 Tax=Phyllosticta capitalensis TaxID=121624 RepID=A0ABR1YVV5_9PEZI
MKSFAALFLALAAFFTATQGFVVTMYDNDDCTGASRSRNVWDNTCAFTDGFQSFKMTTHGGKLQQLTAYSRQACAGTSTKKVCAAGVNAVDLNKCIKARNSNGGSNALSSYSNGGVCPN